MRYRSGLLNLPCMNRLDAPAGGQRGRVPSETNEPGTGAAPERRQTAHPRQLQRHSHSFKLLVQTAAGSPKTNKHRLERPLAPFIDPSHCWSRYTMWRWGQQLLRLLGCRGWHPQSLPSGDSARPAPACSLLFAHPKRKGPGRLLQWLK